MVILAVLTSCVPAPPGGSSPDDSVPVIVTETVAVPVVVVDTAPTLPETCDAGTEAWVARVFPLVLGRRPHGANEVAMWAAEADRHGRDQALRAMATDDRFGTHWSPLLSDLLNVSRLDPGTDSACFKIPNHATHDGDVATYVRDHDPGETVLPSDRQRPWNMADLLLDALFIDDLSVVWRANLFARANYVPFCVNSVDLEQNEHEQRVSLGDELLDVYTGRNLTCIGCHNSEYSVTDDPDPTLDRTWGVDALFEQALLGASWGPDDPETYYAAFRYFRIVKGTDPTYQIYFSNDYNYPDVPWGWNVDCGEFSTAAPPQDVLGVEEGYFLAPFGTEAKLWDIDASLRSGVEALANGPLEIAEDRTVPPDQAFAWLTAQHVVDQLWEAVYGTPLTLPYGFSRNKDQADKLEALTAAFVTEHWSLVELLVAMTTDPLFNTGLPHTCPSLPYGLPPMIDPYSVEDPDALLHGNGPGDLVHRQFARTLLASAHETLGWPAPAEFFFDDEAAAAEFQATIGVFLNVGQAGFNGIDFQSLLAWESMFATCDMPFTDGDMVDDVLALAALQGASVEDAALAIKDRLVARGQWESDGERLEVETLLGVPLETLVDAAGDPGIERNLRLLCGALTLSPEFHLAVEPRPLGPLPAVDLSSAEDCEGLISRWAEIGVVGVCAG